jgi:D-amino-acid dehydrogenase
MATNISNKNYDFAIVGAGIIGASVAKFLAATGASVLVIDKGETGMGCSYGNAGWMTPCFAHPLPRPGMLLKSFKWMLDPEGPLYIKPQPSLLLIKWLTHFLTSMRESKYHAGTEALVQLSAESLNLYRSLSSRHDFGFSQSGLLMITKNSKILSDCVLDMNEMAEFGVPGKTVSKEDILKLEPAVQPDILGGVYYPQEAHGEPLKVVRAILADAQKNGAQLLENCEVSHFATSEGKIHTLETNHGSIHANQIILCTGSYSQSIGKQLGLEIPMLGGKGYAIIVPKLKRQPKIPIMYVEKKLAITPRDNSLRLAGTLELVNQDFSITQRRVDALLRSSREILELPEQLSVQETWAGLRPCTPDGLPILGRSAKLSNLILACGHQMLGLQTGIGSGKLIAQIALNQEPFMETKLFSPERF